MPNDLSASAQRVQEALARHGIDCRVREMHQTTRSAAEAAEAVGCEVGQIAKSLVFRGKTTGRAVLVVASGANRVDVARLADALSEPVGMADPDFVRQETGFAIGGVPPLGHRRALEIFIDADLMQYADIWAAAGTPRAVFSLTPDQLVQITGGRVMTVKQ